MNKGNNFRERKREFKFKSQQPRRGILERERERERESAVGGVREKKMLVFATFVTSRQVTFTKL